MPTQLISRRKLSPFIFVAGSVTCFTLPFVLPLLAFTGPEWLYELLILSGLPFFLELTLWPLSLLFAVIAVHRLEALEGASQSQGSKN